MDEDRMASARPSETGSRASPKPASGLGRSGFDPAREAASLTPSQRASLVAFCGRVNSPYGYYATDVGANGSACASLARKGLLISGWFPHDRSCSYRWTEQGKQVADAIATEARRAATAKQGAVHEGAGRKASPKEIRP